MIRKIYIVSLLTVIILLAISFSISAQNNFFTDAGENITRTTAGLRKIFPQKFRGYEMEISSIRTFLWSLPSENAVLNRNAAPIMEIPMPDGQPAKFRVWESSIMEPGLAAKFPEMRTFSGQGIDDPYATIRFDYNPYTGFHAQILSSAKGRVYIDPYANGDLTYYMSYNTSEYTRDVRFICEVVNTDIENSNSNNFIEAACLGTNLRTYRLALACTGEYSVAVAGPSPTVPAVAAAMLVSVNRVTGVYEKEVSIRMTLVANNNLLIYLNGATDPYTNNNGNTMLGQNQTNIDAVIGNANYDIGHVFSTGGGGIAQLNSPCVTGSKARGVTGQSNPVGDAFDIDYVAHEMGHQWGGNHSMAGCGSSPTTTKFEVGSGTTIQGYAGICGAEDIQPNSDPYFHPISFDEISNYIVSGGGASCGVLTATGNSLPVIDPLPNNGVSIPPSTPFTLSGTASDANGDALTYSWEQWDLQGTQTWNAGATAAINNTVPLFKSRIPKTTGVRTFPDIAVILAGYPANPSATMGGLKGETLSPVARAMKFRLTVRDNRAGGGGVVSLGSGACVNATTYQINVVGTTAFSVTTPNGGESYSGGSTQTITWNAAGTTAAPYNVANVKISLSTDGGNTYPTVISASTPNDGSEALTIPVVVSTTARIKIEAVGNIFFDISNANFTITAPVSGFSFNSPAPATSACPAPASMAITLGTISNGGFSNPITLSAIAGVPGGTNVIFGTNPVTPGNSSVVTLNNTNTLAPGSYVITIQGVASGATTQTRALTYTINAGSGPAITAQPPNRSICTGTNTTFTITSATATGFQWQLSTDGGTIYNSISNGGVYSGATTATLTITGATTGMNNYRYRCISSVQCGSTTSNAGILTVNANVTAGTVSGTSPLCIGQTNTYTSNGTGGGAWSSTAPSVASVHPSTGLVTALAAGTTNITYTVSSGCGSPVSSIKALTANALPVVSCPANSSVCISTAAFSLSGGSPTGGTYSGTGVSGGQFDPVIAGVGTHTITYSYTNPSTNCSNSCTYTITVNPLPVITLIGPAFACLNSPGNVYTTETGMTNYIWNVTNGTITAGGTTNSSSATVTWGAAGPFSISVNYTNVNGCTATSPQLLNVSYCTTEYIRGSVQKNIDPTKIDIVFRPNFTSVLAEYIHYFQFSLAIPVGISGGVTATAIGVNTFSNMGTITQAPQYTEGSERIFTWIFADPTPATQSWTNGVDFTGIQVTFSTTAAAAVGKMVDFTNIGGGGNANTYFAINSTRGDVTDYPSLFYSIPGQSTLGTYPNNDQFVYTTAAGLVNDDAPGAILLTVGAGCAGSPYTNAGATQSGSEPYAACEGTVGYKTAWYKFIAPASGAVKISNDFGGGTMGSDSRMALFSTTNVNSYATFTNIACDDNNGVTVSDRSILYANGLTSGNTYYIQVDGKDGSTAAGTFCLTVDELSSSMISTVTACAAGQSLAAVNDNYIGWLSATDANGKLIALLSNPSGGVTTSTYTNNLNINLGPVRSDAISGQKYLDRNFSINNASVSNVNVRFFMLNTELTALQAVDPGVTLSNLQVTRQTGVTCDNNFVAANGTNSSLAQTGNGTGTGYSWVQVTTPGFSKFFIHTNKSFLPVRTFLQGAYSGTQHKAVTSTWAAVLNANALSQPYSGVPFSYTGTETVSPGFFTSGVSTTEVSDWVLLELRDATTPATVITRRAAFIREDGRIVELDGVSELSFRNVVPGNYHLVIRHRNHLSIRTATTRTLNGTMGFVAPALYDFSTGQAQAYQDVAITANTAMKDLGGGAFGMWGGNANGMTTPGFPAVRATGPLAQNDYLYLVTTALGGNVGIILSNVYNPADMNMDGQVRATGPLVQNDYLFLITTVLGGDATKIITQHQ